MDAGSHLLQHSAMNNHAAAVLARLGRPIPGPFAHFGSPIAPYSVPNPANPYDFHSSAHFQLAAAGYSIDNLLHPGGANAANSRNFLASLTSSAGNLHRRESSVDTRIINGKKGKSLSLYIIFLILINGSSN